MDHDINTLANWSWDQLNEVVRTADEATCVALLRTELSPLGKKRKIYCERIHSRLIRVRADRERRELDNVRIGLAPRKDIKWL